MKKKILSFLFIFCIACSVGLFASACKKKVTIKSSDLYYGDTNISVSNTLTFNYGENITTKLNNVKIVVKFSNKTEKTYKYSDFAVTLTYTYADTDTVLDTLPEDSWEVGTYKFIVSVTPENFDTITKQFIINVVKSSRPENFAVNVNGTKENCSWIYDDSLNHENDPLLSVVDGDIVFNGTADYMYLTSDMHSAYNALQSDEEKLTYLQNNGFFFTSSYRFDAGTYYMYAKLHSDKNHIDKFTPFTKVVVEEKELDLSDVRFSLEYTFSTDKNTPEQTFVTLDDIAEGATMPEIDGLYGHFEWLENNPTQFSYSKNNNVYILKTRFVLDKPSYKITPQTFDVPLTINQGLIQTPVFNESFDGFTYKGYAQGFNQSTTSSICEHWFTTNDLKFLDITGLELHTDAGDYTSTFSIVENNPNFAFTSDGETALPETTYTLNWQIKKAQQTYLINGLYPDNKCCAFSSGIVYLPNVVDDGRGMFLKDSYQLLINNGTGDEFGEGTISGSEFDFLLVSKTGKFIIKIYSPGNKNLEPINDSFEINVEKFTPSTPGYKTTQNVESGSNLTQVKLPGNSTTKGYGNWVWSTDGETQVSNYESVVFTSTTKIYAIFIPTNPTVASTVKIEVTITVS